MSSINTDIPSSIAFSNASKSASVTPVESKWNRSKPSDSSTLMSVISASSSSPCKDLPCRCANNFSNHSDCAANRLWWTLSLVISICSSTLPSAAQKFECRMWVGCTFLARLLDPSVLAESHLRFVFGL